LVFSSLIVVAISMKAGLLFLAISHQPVLQDAADLVYRMEGGKLVLVSENVARVSS